MKKSSFTLSLLALAVVSAIGISSMVSFAQAPSQYNQAAPQGQQQQFNGQRRGQGFQGQNQRPGASATIKRTVTNIENGVVVTCTSDNADEVKMIQSHTPPTPPADSKVTVVKENLSNGIKVTITSTDAETVKKIQTREAQGGPRGMRGDNGSQDDSAQRPELKDVKRVVTNTDNGVNISITSTDAATVKLIQEREAKMGQGQNGLPRFGGHRGPGMGMQRFGGQNGNNDLPPAPNDAE